ncbi:MAG: PAS domain S-box protein [Bacteroidetes bacterium]|nr:MAG: PAS domain S-box protein [Bacteroidota bacterium]
MNQEERDNPANSNIAEEKTQDTTNTPAEERNGFCVGVGASAGGLEALEQFFRKMPPDSGLSFVVVQHLSPDYKSLMVELLSKHTMMQVQRAEDGMKIMPNCIYLIPPKKNMTIFHGTLFLTDKNLNHIINLPIDIFFRSLAEDYGDKSVGIILSGTGSDGTLGIRAIKGIGGMVMAQDDNSAKFDGMPRSAIATGMVDYILPAEKMPEELLKYVKHPLTSKARENENTSGQDNTLGKILSIIRNTTGVDFTYYKPNTIIRRLERRISINQISSYDDYVTFLEQSVKEANILYKELLIGVTRFFRDTDSFDIIKEQVIPQILKNKSKDDPIRFWSVGCSTGEEVYSLAMLLKEHIGENDNNHDIKIFATDLDKESIEYGSMGLYPESIVADVSMERLKKFFIKKEKGYQIKENIRKMVIFATHNIIKDPPFSKIDLISCRNMLIYLKPQMQKKVLSLFHFSLHKKGYLFLGSSESLGDLSKNFNTINSKWKIYSFKDNYNNDNIGDFLLPSVQRPGNSSMMPVISAKSHETSDLTDYIYNSIIEEFLPPSLIIDENFEIVHILKDVNKYIKLPSGKVSLDILSLIRKEICTTLSIAIHKAFKEDKEIIYNGFKLREKGEIIHLNIKVKPIAKKIKSRKLLFIAFEEQHTIKTIISENDSQSIEYDTNQQIKDLELELKYTRENLQATIEELGTSNEELQATNEELIASNEELQSTNEELQSVNEELYTVNSEYQNKIDILTQLNNDINNLLKNTNIGTVFLDRNLLIRKFTPAVTSAINILDMDIGRPIHHISHNTLYDSFLEDIENVLRTLVIKEVEVQGKKNNWFLMRILPYRTLENAIDGVVITFFDITERKIFEEQIQRKSNLLISVLDNSPVASTILDENGKITYANHMAEKVLGLTKDEITRRNYNTPKWKITDENGKDFPDEKLPFFIVTNTGRPVFDVIHNIEWPDGTLKTLSINGSPIFDEHKKVDGVICTLIDITQKREYEEKLNREHELLIRVLQNSPNAKIMTDSKGKITFANKLASQLFKITEEKISNGTSFEELEIVSAHSPEDKNNIIQKVVNSGKNVYNQQFSFASADRAKEALFITASPAFDNQEKVSEVVMSIDCHSNLNINSDLMTKQVSSLSNLIETGIFTLDNKSIITTWNNKAEIISGLKAKDVIGKQCYASHEKETKGQRLPCFLLDTKRNSMQCKSLIIVMENKQVSIEANNIEVIKNLKDQVIGAMGFFEKIKK